MIYSPLDMPQGLRRGYPFTGINQGIAMPVEPAIRRTIAFFDGQNLFYAAKYAFGYAWPNYDPLKLAQAVCRTRG